MSIEVPSNPAALAAPIAETRFTDATFDGSVQDEADLVRLGNIAEQAGLMGKWMMDASRVIITPRSFDADDYEVEFCDLRSVYYEGNFICYSRVSIGRIVGCGDTVRALCLTSNNGIVINPNVMDIAKDVLLHVPVLAINDMQRPPKR